MKSEETREKCWWDTTSILRPSESSRQVRLGPAVEAVLTWRQTISAPAVSVWDEVATLDAILSPVATLNREDSLGDRSASLAVQLRCGPLARVAHCRIALLPVEAPHHLLVVAGLEEVPLAYRGEVDLIETGAARNTLRVSGRLRCHHWLARRSQPSTRRSWKTTPEPWPGPNPTPG